MTQQALPNVPQLAILFDLDGTLIDSITLLLNSMEFAFENRSHRPSKALWTAGIGIPLRTQLAEWASSAEDTEVLVNRYREYQSIHLESLTTLYAAVQEVLEWIQRRGHVLGVVTSKGRGMTSRSLGHVGIADLFNVIVTADSLGRHKPLPDPVWHALDAVDVPRSRALFVGDSTHDMIAGRAAGVTTAAALWGPFSREELEMSQPDHWLASMNDLIPIIEAMERAIGNAGPSKT